MKQDALLILGKIDARFVDEAAEVHVRRMPLRPLAIAAALTLVIGVSAGILLRRPAVGPSPAVQSETLQQAEAREQAEQSAEKSDSPRSGGPEDAPLSERLLSMRMGGLQLGQSMEEIRALLGEPDGVSNVSVTLSDGITRLNWFYRLAAPDRYDLTLELADNGAGYVLNRVRTGTELPGGLPFGLRPGMSRREALDALKADPSVEPFVEETENELSVRAGHAELQVWLEDGQTVSDIWLGMLYPYPDERLGESESEPGIFASGTITVWQRRNGAWESVTVTDRAAKRIEVTFSIMDLEPWEDDGSGCTLAADFHNGTVALLCEEDAGRVYELADRAAFEASMAAGVEPEGLTRAECVRFPEGCADTLRDCFASGGQSVRSDG